ncbi:MAG: hypothetical protein M3367_15100 [Acidobacteriota bacterium]|nr:hypothetical protein [Acidobacteriota bacterium]
MSEEKLIAREKVRSVNIWSEFGDTARSHNYCKQYIKLSGKFQVFAKVTFRG